MERLVANLSSNIRKETISGREYLVAPVTMIVPGILNGSRGPLLYSIEAVSHNVDAWNGVPLLANHPKSGSGRNPSVLNEQGIGTVFSSSFGDKLTAEAWFDIENTRRVDHRILNALEAGQKIELSTGLSLDTTPAEANATFNGQPYSFSVSNLRPDHLAILMDSEGACSLDAGCGVLNAKRGRTGTTNNHSHSVSLSDSGSGLTSSDHGHSHKVSSFVVQESNGHRHSLSQTGLTNNRKGKGDSKMSLTDAEKKMAVDSIIANSCCHEEEDREVLNEASDERLQTMAKAIEKQSKKEAIANSILEGFTDADGSKHVYNAEKKDWVTTKKVVENIDDEDEENEKGKTKNKDKKMTKNTKPPTEEEWLQSAPPSVRENLEFAENEKAKQKTTIADRLVSNVKDEQEQGRLHTNFMKMDLGTLQDLALTLPPEKAPVLNYAGAASPATPTVENAEANFAPFGNPLDYIENETDE